MQIIKLTMIITVGILAFERVIRTINIVLRESVLVLAFLIVEIHPVVADTIVVADLRLFSVLFFSPTLAIVAVITILVSVTVVI